jgi:hypothetical protein
VQCRAFESSLFCLELVRILIALMNGRNEEGDSFVTHASSLCTRCGREAQ